MNFVEIKYGLLTVKSLQFQISITEIFNLNLPFFTLFLVIHHELRCFFFFLQQILKMFLICTITHILLHICNRIFKFIYTNRQTSDRLFAFKIYFLYLGELLWKLREDNTIFGIIFVLFWSNWVVCLSVISIVLRLLLILHHGNINMSC